MCALSGLHQDSYLATLPEAITEELKASLDDMFEWLMDPLFDFLRHHAKVFMRTSELHLVWVSVARRADVGCSSESLEA